MAKQQLSQEYPDNPFYASVLADVYVGLTDEEPFRLAQRHNLNSHFVHKVSHRDLVCLCVWYINKVIFYMWCTKTERTAYVL